MDQLKAQIQDLAKSNLIDEIRFIDCGKLSAGDDDLEG